MKLIYFSAPWCGPCKQLGPIMDDLATQIEVQKINVDNSPDITSHYGIRNVPTVVAIDSFGSERGRKVGLNPKQAYLDMYNEN
jgi:thioredoxin 1